MFLAMKMTSSPLLNISLTTNLNETTSPPRLLFTIMCVWAAVTGLLGVIGNTTALVMFARFKNVRKEYFSMKNILYDLDSIFHCQLRTPFNCLLVNLAVTDLVISLLGSPVLAYNSFHEEWKLSDRSCKLYAFGMTFLGG